MAVAHSYTKARLSVMVNSVEVWFAQRGNGVIEGALTGQVTLSEGENDITFLGKLGGEYTFIQTNLTNAECIEMGRYLVKLDSVKSSTIVII